MKLILKRHTSSHGCTIGELLLEGKHFCWTLEDEVRENPDLPVEKWKVPGATAIPRGIYRVVIDFSFHFQKELPHILDVPGFSGVRIHSGNTAEDTEGCVLLGKVALSDSLQDSRAAFNELFPLLQSACDRDETITIEVI